jgi:3-hydroxybutyryl-CoA dehydrogenase
LAVADMAGLDVYDFCSRSLHDAYPDRFTAPDALTDRVKQGRLGVKSGGGFLPTPTERLPDLIAYRDGAYAAMRQLLDRHGTPDIDY